MLSALHVAFSRRPGQPKTYVQHLIAKEAVQIWGLLSTGGAMYICGDARMADSVVETIGELAQTVGMLTTHEARGGRFCRRLEAVRAAAARCVGGDAQLPRGAV